MSPNVYFCAYRGCHTRHVHSKVAQATTETFKFVFGAFSFKDRSIIPQVASHGMLVDVDNSQHSIPWHAMRVGSLQDVLVK